MTTPIGPDFIALQVRDLAASRKFYVDIYGFEALAHCPPGAVVFKTEPIPLALREPLRALPEVGPLGVGMVLWIACADADALHDLIIKRGGVIVRSRTAPLAVSSSRLIPMATRSPSIRLATDPSPRPAAS